MNLAKIAIKRPTFIIALLMVFVILGAVSLNKLSVRMFPDVEFPYVLIMTSYPGAGVAEIEQLVSKPIEDAVSGVSALKHVSSINQDNMSVVFCEFQLSKNPDIATQEVRDKVGQIRLDLPDDIKEPVIMKADINSLPIGTISLKAKGLTPKQMYDFADDVVSKDLAQVSGVSQINIIGGQKREIHINADKNKLKNYELTLTSLAAKIKSNSLNIPAGKVNRGANEVEFRTLGEFRSVAQINDVVVNFLGNDRRVTVGDVAAVEDGVEKEVSRARIDIKKNGNFASEPALLLQIYRQAKGNDVAISDGIKKKIAEVNQKYLQYDGRPQLTMISDSAHGVRMNIENVKSTIIEGVFLAIIVVYLFLASWRSTFITALSLPNSLIGSFVFMYAFGFSLNVLSLMALSLAVGLLIDDAIVVRENIFRHYEEGSNPIKAALDGTNEVTLAVIATTSTVIAVFLPVAFLSGVMGQFFKEFGLTVVFAMFISILDALTIAPLLSAYMIPDHNAKKAKKGKPQEFIIKIFRKFTVEWFNLCFNILERAYKKLILFIVKAKVVDFEFGKNKNRFSISWKFTTLIIAAFIFIFTISVAKKYLKATFMPAAEWGEFNINLQSKPGTSLDQMDRYTRQVEEILMNDPNIELVSVAVGQSGMFSNLASQSSMYVKMIPAESKGEFFGLFSKKKNKNISKRTRSSSQMKDYLREVFKEKFGDELEVSIVRQSVGGGGESEFIMELNGDNIDVLYDVSQVLIKRFKEIPYFVDVHSNYKIGKPEVQIQMDPKKMEDYGVSSVVVGNEVRAMIDGALAGKFRDNGLEYDIKVRFAQDQQDIAQNLDAIYINNVNNKLVKLKNVASLKMAEGPTQIFREDRVRYISVEGNLAAGGTINEIQKEAIRIFNEEKSKPENLEQWKHVRFGLFGNAEDMAEMFKSIIIAAGLSLIFIFMVLASLYESIITPFTIMIALPLAIIGGLLALLMVRQPIDMFTLIGMIMLLGIVAKNSILLVDYIQQQMRDGLNIDDAIIKAGIVRLRPILMTSFALIAGMLPTALGLSEVGQFRKGMGIVVIGGVISSTVLTLIVVPAIFEYMDKLRLFLRRLAKRPEKRMIDYTEEQLHKQDL
ncbi:MAG: efflux RND transporter permease subunit [Endomicrobium sp.]|jgi:hydrophobe/amphiphile efflux-1 (HAE1) family protein|uniref:efflux RND transporter permease subunit n=1 Tax=Candidatus Endomicrobiellum cubanum TaxID=3242325 RepID=UPI0028342DEC|nr:efflux RND transporter permease subunit [Endomicrobium sp.]